MVKFGELRIQQLKKELEERNLPISGQKADLQARLREAMEADGINVDEFEFVGPETSTKVEEKVEEQRTSSSVDMNTLLVAIKQIIAENTSQIAENAVQTENRLAQQIAENISQITENVVQTENRLAQQMTQIAENTSQLESRLTQQITENTTQLQKQVQEKFSKFEDELSTLKNGEENLKSEVLQLSNRVRELQLHGLAPSTNNQRLKAPTFDGSIPFQIFKLQFEKTATANNWNAADKVASLFVSLKGPAAEILQTIPDCERDNYEALMSAIERRYGSEHRKQIYQIELQNRGQKMNESLQEFATEIERLAHLANADAPVDYIERVKIQCFINGIRDVDTKRATYALPKRTFAETVSHALTQETASLLSKPAHKVQRVEMEQPALMEEILKTLKTIAAQRVNTTGRCFNCRKAGHFARNCKIKVNPSKWKQPTEHRKRIHHKNADALSHRPCPLEFKHCSKSEGKEGIIDVRSLNIEPEDDWTPHRIRINQLEDPDLAKLVMAKENGVRPPKEQISSESPTAKAYWAQWNSINLVNGYLHRTWESEDGKQSRLLIIVPKSMIPKVLKEYHNGPSGGHLGITKTIEKIKQRFYWIGCRDSIAEWISNCVECMAAKGPKAKSRGRLQQYNVGSPFERVAMDVAGPFPTSTAGNKYLLVVMDYFSKWPEVYALPNQEAKTVAEAFVENWITRFGVPVELHSDQGRNFESSIFQEVCTLLGIHKTRTTALYPQSDGMVERFNRTLEEHLRKIVDKDQRNWDKCIQMFLLAYRSAKHETTGYTPAKIIFGSDLRLPADLKIRTNPTAVRNDGDYCSALKEEMNELHLMVRQHTHLMSNKMKDRFDQAANSKGFEEGDLVLLYNPLRKKGLSPKLQTAWEGPYMVMKRLNDVVYRIQRNGKARCKMKVVHLERLAPFGSRGFVPNRDD
ncbi:uncharacterized protein LOC125777350 [Bactrocera dorsalis]|uniref:RNA-directed DNA polymerase n=1 Tax=Bactrocera dorsalis TaxID=27457 RepID=A0ABM3JFQ6_BACDO|nr:uncharacterized protein LOC125777350 [Bactrocera dorsalis]